MKLKSQIETNGEAVTAEGKPAESVQSEPEKVKITEAQPPANEPEAKPEESKEAEPTETVAASVMATAELAEYLTAKNIPQAVRDRVARGTYANVAEVDKAVTEEIAYIKEATLSGKPRIPANAETKQAASLRERESNVRAVLSRYR